MKHVELYTILWVLELRVSPRFAWEDQGFTLVFWRDQALKCVFTLVVRDARETRRCCPNIKLLGMKFHAVHHTITGRVDAARAYMPYPEVAVAHAPSGPLQGLRLAVKDVFHVAGYPTSMGQPWLAAALGVQHHHSQVVSTLLAAGASFAGKTVSDEMALSMTGQNLHYGAPINGSDPNRIAGGSSSGSAAAVSNGLADIALGTDTGGSVRAPANHCGLWGLRPTHARVSTEGVLPQSDGLDTVGWFARDAHTGWLVAQTLMGSDESPLPSEPTQVRWLVPASMWDLSADVARPHHESAWRSMASVWDIQPQELTSDWRSADDESLYWAFRRIQGFEAWQHWGDFMDKARPPLAPNVADRFQWAKTVRADDYHAALVVRDQLRAELDALLSKDGVLVVPTMPDIAPLCVEPESNLEDYRNRAIRLLCVAGLAGLPQLSLPIGQRDGAPLGISLIGPRGSDVSLCALAAKMLNRE